MALMLYSVMLVVPSCRLVGCHDVWSVPGPCPGCCAGAPNSPPPAGAGLPPNKPVDGVVEDPNVDVVEDPKRPVDGAGVPPKVDVVVEPPKAPPVLAKVGAGGAEEAKGVVFWPLVEKREVDGALPPKSPPPPPPPPPPNALGAGVEPKSDVPGGLPNVDCCCCWPNGEADELAKGDVPLAPNPLGCC